VSTESTELAHTPEVSGRIARLRYDREEGRRAITRGAILVLSTPVAALASLPIAGMLRSIAPLLICGVYCIVGGATGVVMVGVGLVQSRAAAKRLEELERERIPEARLLHR
jgi:hypothetical protein